MERKRIIGYEDKYDISDTGEVRRLVYSNQFGDFLCDPPIILKHCISTKTGYPYVSLWRGNKKVNKTIHSLLMEAFNGPLPPGKEVAHFDGNKLNFSLENLRYVTSKENKQDNIRLGKVRRGEKVNFAKTNESDVRKIRELNKLGVSRLMLSYRFKLSKHTIGLIVRGITWKHV